MIQTISERSKVRGKRVLHKTFGKGLCLFENKNDEITIRFDYPTELGEIVKLKISQVQIL